MDYVRIHAVIKMSFGEKIKNLREDTEPKLTQEQLGKIIGISQRKMSRIEKNCTEPNLDDIKELCKFFKISADYLLDLPPMPYPKR